MAQRLEGVGARRAPAGVERREKQRSQAMATTVATSFGSLRAGIWVRK